MPVPALPLQPAGDELTFSARDDAFLDGAPAAAVPDRKGYWRMELPSVYIFTIGLPLRLASVNALLSMGMQSTVTGLPASMYGQV